MPRSDRRTSTGRSHVWLVTLFPVVTAIGACEVPNFHGPQIQSPPQGFLLVPDSYGQRRMFPQHEVVYHDAWVESMKDFSTIYINAHPGALTLEDVMAAQDAARLDPSDPDVTFGNVEPLAIDGRSGWGWAERVETPSRGLVSVAYRAIVPYDTLTYAIEFYSGEPGLKRAAPDTLRAVVASFAVGRTEWNLPLIAIMAGLLLFAANVVRTKREERTARLRSINLVSVKKEEAEADSPGEERAVVRVEALAPSGPLERSPE